MDLKFFCKSKVRMSLLVLCFFALNLFTNAQTAAPEGVPGEINFDGIITDNDGNIIPDGEYLIIFSLYDKPSGGNALWTEIHNNVEIINGEVSVCLGDGSDADSFSSLFNKQLYLGIKLGYDEELSPRVKLLPAPFSMKAKTALELRNNSIASDKIAPLAVTDDKIINIDWNKIINVPDFNLTADRNNREPESTAELPYYWRRHGNYLAAGDEFLGTVNDRNLVIKTDSVTRMVFDPYGDITMGTVEDSVLFEVIGKSTFVDVYVKGRLGVGSDFNNTYCKLQVTATGNRTPFRIDYNLSDIFNIDPEGRVVITSTLTGGDNSTDNYPLFIDAVDQGIAIQLEGSVDGDNNYVSFWDDDGATGSIEGQTAGEYLSDPVNIAHDVWLAAQITALAVAMSSEPLEIPDVIKLVDEVVYFEFELGWNLFNVGVTYESGGADYAEWLEKKNPSDIFGAGDVVGVFGGKISRQTEGAEQIMTISLAPFVLGNMPGNAEKSNYEKVAFKGQVPVKVLGTVTAGDYIIPSGLNDGIGIAVSPELMTGEEYSKTVGKAWQSSGNSGVKLVNVGIGLGLKDVVSFITRDVAKNDAVRKDILSKDKFLESIESKVIALKENLSILKNVLNQYESENIHEQKMTLK